MIGQVPLDGVAQPELAGAAPEEPRQSKRKPKPVAPDFLQPPTDSKADPAPLPEMPILDGPEPSLLEDSADDLMPLGVLPPAAAPKAAAKRDKSKSKQGKEKPPKASRSGKSKPGKEKSSKHEAGKSAQSKGDDLPVDAPAQTQPVEITAEDSNDRQERGKPPASKQNAPGEPHPEQAAAGPSSAKPPAGKHGRPETSRLSLVHEPSQSAGRPAVDERGGHRSDRAPERSSERASRHSRSRQDRGVREQPEILEPTLEQVPSRQREARPVHAAASAPQTISRTDPSSRLAASIKPGKYPGSISQSAECGYVEMLSDEGRVRYSVQETGMNKGCWCTYE